MNYNRRQCEKDITAVSKLEPIVRDRLQMAAASSAATIVGNLPIKP